MHRYDKGEEDPTNDVNPFAKGSEDPVPDEDRVRSADVNVSQDTDLTVNKYVPHDAATTPNQDSQEAKVAVQSILEKQPRNMREEIEGVKRQVVEGHS